jgi:hypothetical protein
MDSNVHDSPFGDCHGVPRLTGRGGATVSPIGVRLAAVFEEKQPPVTPMPAGHRGKRSVVNPGGIAASGASQIAHSWLGL